MSSWYSFDKPTPEETHRDELLTEIEAAQERVLQEIVSICKLIEKHPLLVRQAGMSTLGHISYLARQKANAIGREDLHAFADAAIGRKVPTL